VKSLSARQAELVGRNARSYMPLVRLRSYTDKKARTGTHDFYFGDRALIFDYANASALRYFDPFLLRIDGSLRLAMPHLPPDRGGGDLDGGRALKMVLHNGEYEYGGDRVIAALRAYNLELADVELAQLDRDYVREDLYDLRSLVGDEHVVWCRSEIEQVERVTDEEITLTLRSREPEIPWRILNDATNNDPRDLGKRLPFPYGARKRVPCLGVTVGWKTTLAEELTAAATGNRKVGDASGFPAAGTFTMRVAGEEMTAAYVDATTVNITARGINSTTAAAHLNGTIAVEMIATAVFCCAGFALSAIDAVWIKSPFTDEWVRVENTALYSTSFSATVAGGTATTISFTAANLRTLLNGLEQQALVTANTSVTQQPVVSHPVRATAVDQHPSSQVMAGSNFIDDNITTGEPIASMGSTLNVTFTDLGTIVEQRIYVHVDGVASNLEVFTGAGASLGTITSSSSGWYSFPCTDDTHTFYVVNQGASTRGVNEFLRTMTYDVDSPSIATNTAVAPVAIAAAEFGIGIELRADVRGPVASGGNYSVANGTLIEHTADILRHIIAELCGEGHTPGDGHTAPDATTFAATVTNLGASFKMAPELTELGDSFGPVTNRIAFEAASNLVLEEASAGSVWRLLNPSLSGASYKFPVPTVTLTEWGEGFAEIGRNSRSLFTRFRALYDRDASLGDGEDSYRAVLRADADSNDLATTWVPTADFTAAEAKFGRRDHPGFGFLCIADPASAKFTLGYYAQEQMRLGATFAIPAVPWWESYALERGDTVYVTPRWESTPRALRIVEYAKDWADEIVGLLAVEVRT
jgi:hypothetical protein